MLAQGSRLLGPLFFLRCTFSPFLFSLEDLHCLLEACYLSSGFFSVCIVLIILVVWYSLSWLIHRGFGLDFISFLLSGGSGVLGHRACSGDILFSVLVPYYRGAEHFPISLALHRRKVEEGHTLLFF